MLMAKDLQAKEARNAGPDDFRRLSLKLSFSSLEVKRFLSISLTSKEVKI